MKHALYFNDLTVEQLGRLLAAWTDLNSKYDPGGTKKIPEPRVYLVDEGTKPLDFFDRQQARFRDEMGAGPKPGQREIEFPTPWTMVGDSVEQMKRQISESEVIYLDERAGVGLQEADVEVAANASDAKGSLVRAFTRKGYEWILKLP